MIDSRPLQFSTKPETFRHALLVTQEVASPEILVERLDGAASLLDVIMQQGLAPLWHYRLDSAGSLQKLSGATADQLHQARVMASARYLLQKQALAEIDQLFEDHGLRYAVMKGVHLRECVYPEPSVRLTGDIDLLVSPDDRFRAGRLLRDAGFTPRLDASVISHEACFVRKKVDVDLHWDVLRPGRMRVDVIAGFIARRQRCDGFWVLSDDDALFTMLTHPAFAKYVNSPNMGLFRVADFLLWSQHRKVNWPSVVQLLDSTGLKAAAWTMLEWYRMLAAPDQAAILGRWQRDVQPGRLRAAYLGYWLSHGLPGRWLERPLRIQFGLTLFLHDRPADAWRAVCGWWRSRRNRQRDILSLRNLDEAPDAIP